jgi:hypothetical protein
LRRLSLTLGFSASRKKRFLLVHIRLVRSVIHDRLEQNSSLARIVYLRKHVLAIAFAAGDTLCRLGNRLHTIRLCKIGLSLAVPIGRLIFSLKRLAALAATRGIASSVLKSVPSEKSRVKSLSASGTLRSSILTNVTLHRVLVRALWLVPSDTNVILSAVLRELCA